MSLKTFFAFDPKDTEEIRLEKFAAFLVSASCTFAGSIWALMYYFVFGWGLISFLPVLFVTIVGSSLLISHISKNHYYAIYTQIFCIIYITAFIQWSIGGVFDSGIVMTWAFIGPICALMFFSVKKSVPWLVLYLINLMITFIFNDYFASHGLGVSENIRVIFFTMNMSFASVIVFIFASYYVNAAVREQKKVNMLLETNLQQKLILRQNENLATLGKLSAGVAHELNNPASATKRGAEQLKKILAKREEIKIKLAAVGITKDQMESLNSHIENIQRLAKEPLEFNALTRSDQENEIEIWLEKKGVGDGWEMAPVLINLGYDCDKLAKLAENFSNDSFPVIIAFISNMYSTWKLMEEISEGSGRISDIVKALKSYTYLDQAPMQSVDIHEGLNDTLVMLRSRLKEGVQVKQEYDRSLPCIEVFGGELNQVWTNIIDNAIDAMNEKGEIFIKTYKKDDSWAVVEIQDSGPGIPQEIQSKIFDPFFTSKPPGEGTGLGLNISYNIIVQKHKGSIEVTSKPGKTCFRVWLPIHNNGKSK